MQAEAVARICREMGSLTMRVARDDAERALLWKGRKEAAGAVGRITHNYVLQDAVVPRSKLPTVMAQIQAIAARHGLVVANVFHAGDGNLHPMICYDERIPGEFARALEANEEVLHACIDLGGTVTGEHGVGLDKAEKLALLFNPDDLEVMHAVRARLRPARAHESPEGVPVGPARLRADARPARASRCRRACGSSRRGRGPGAGRGGGAAGRSLGGRPRRRASRGGRPAALLRRAHDRGRREPRPGAGERPRAGRGPDGPRRAPRLGRAAAPARRRAVARASSTGSSPTSRRTSRSRSRAAPRWTGSTRSWDRTASSSPSTRRIPRSRRSAD